ncbi:MAG: auracyanin family protein, partial [Planctomycetota bacterium]
MRHHFLTTSMLLGACFSMGLRDASGQESTQKKDFKESDYYAIRSYEIPEGVELEATSFQRMPDGKLAVASRRGEIW